MARRTWTLALEDGAHRVELEHGYWSARRRIYVDGLPVAEVVPDNLFETVSRWNATTEHSFRLGSHQCAVRIRPRMLDYDVDLIVDGRSMRTLQPATPLRAPPLAPSMRREMLIFAGLWAASGILVLLPLAVLAPRLGPWWVLLANVLVGAGVLVLPLGVLVPALRHGQRRAALGAVVFLALLVALDQGRLPSEAADLLVPFDEEVVTISDGWPGDGNRTVVADGRSLRLADFMPSPAALGPGRYRLSLSRFTRLVLKVEPAL